MPLGTEVGLGPGDILLDGAQLPPCTKGHSSPSPTFQPVYIVAKRFPCHRLLSYCRSNSTQSSLEKKAD